MYLVFEYQKERRRKRERGKEWQARDKKKRKESTMRLIMINELIFAGVCESRLMILTLLEETEE